MGHLRRVKKMLAPQLYEYRVRGDKDVRKKRKALKVIAVISAEWIAKKRKKILQRFTYHGSRIVN